MTVYPISHMTDEIRKAHPTFLMHAPNLVDGDYNPFGWSVTYFDDNDHTWRAAGYDMCGDKWVEFVIEPDFYILLDDILPPGYSETSRSSV